MMQGQGKINNLIQKNIRCFFRKHYKENDFTKFTKTCNVLIELKKILKDEHCDAFRVSEHWAKKDQIKSITTEGYPPFIVNKTLRHGGTAIYVSNGIDCFELDNIMNQRKSILSMLDQAKSLL